jgi:hypothetical protein
MKASGWLRAVRFSTSATRVLWPARCLCLRISHRIRNMFMLRHTGPSADPWRGAQRQDIGDPLAPSVRTWLARRWGRDVSTDNLW